MLASCLLADVDDYNSLHELVPSGSGVMEFAVFGGAFLLVTLAVFGWAIIAHSRRKRRRHSSHHHHHSRSGHAASIPRRRPSLAEAGGLPPVRLQPSPAPPR